MKKNSIQAITRHGLFLSAIIACAAFFPASVAAADTTDSLGDQGFEDSIFGSSKPDGSASPSGYDANIAAGEKASTEFLAGGNILVSSSATIIPDPSSTTATAYASGKLFGKVTVPDYGSLFAAYTASYSFFQGYTGNGTAPSASDQSSITYALSEFHYSFDIGKVVFIRLGKQLISWGPSQIWTPVDFINGEKANAFADVDTRVGKNGLRLHMPLTKGNIFAFADFSGMTSGNVYGNPVETVNLGGRVDFTAAAFEFGFTGYGGKNAQSRVGADFSGRILGMTIYGEFAFTPKEALSSTGTQISLGFSRTIDELKRWTLSAEGFYNSSGKDYSGYSTAAFAAVPATERMILYQGTLYAYASLNAQKFLSPDIASRLMAIANIQDNSYWVRLSSTFTIPNAVPFTFAASYYGGGTNKELTRYTGNNAIMLTLSTKISF